MMTFSVLQTFICLAMGLSLGVCGGMLGIGGGLIAIPVLSYVFNMPQPLAQGTVLLMVIPNVLLSFIQYRKRNYIDLKQTFLLCLISSVSAFFAAGIATYLAVDKLTYLFSGFLFVIALYYVFQISFPGRLVRIRVSDMFLPLLGILSGITSGLFTVGGSLVVVPLLMAFFSFTQTQAQGMALALVVPGGIAALASYTLAGHVDWYIGVPLAIGGVISVSWGVTLAHKLPPSLLKLTFCAMLFFVAISVLLKT